MTKGMVTSTTDVYSFGRIILMLLEKEFKSNTNKTMIVSKLKEAVEMMIKKTPEERITIGEVLSLLGKDRDHDESISVHSTHKSRYDNNPRNSPRKAL